MTEINGRIAGVAVVYFLAGWFGLSVASEVSSSITVVWAPSGIALAAVRLWGRPMLLGVFLGALAVNLSFGEASVIAAPLIAIGNTTEALVASTVFSYFIPNRRRPSDPEWFTWLIIAGLAGCAVAATVGVGALTITDGLAEANAANAWVTWLSGDFFGILLITTAILSIFPPNRHVPTT
jgi:integral membrane sensor domain MASE1